MSTASDCSESKVGVTVPLSDDGRMHPLIRFLLDRLPDAAALEEVAIVVPTAGAANALRRALLEQRDGLVGVHFVTVPALARLLCERQGAACPADRPDPLVERAILMREVQGDGAMASYARRFPSALRELAGAIREWQGAGRPIEATDAWAREFVAIGTRFTAATRSFATRTTLLDLASQSLANGVRYRGPSTIVLVSPRGGADFDRLLDRLEPHGVRIEFAPEPVDVPATVRASSSPDPEAELRRAASACLDATTTLGATFRDCVVAVPQLGEYAMHLRRAFRAEGVPFTSAVESPLAAEPRAAACAHAADLLFGETSRRAYFGLLASPLLRSAPRPAELHRFDALSRDDHFYGRGERARDFARYFRSKLDSTEKPVAPAILDRWLDEADDAESRRTTEARVAVLSRFLTSALRPPAPNSRDAQCHERIGQALRAMVDASKHHDAGGSGDEFAARVRTMLSERGMPTVGACDDGVQIVEFADALAHPARHLFLCGMVEGLVPRRTGGGVFLREKDREALGLPSSHDVRATERDHLDALCRHASDSCTISRPRRRSDGGSVAASLWLDELPLTLPTEDREPTHPLSRARERIRRGRCPRDLALTALAIESDEPEPIVTVLGPGSRSIWDSARDLERFEPTSLARDGDLGPGVGHALAESSLSVSNLRTLGYCPQQFLFSTVLGLRPLPPEPDPCELPRDRLGRRIHTVLERLFERYRESLASATDCSEFFDRMLANAEQLLEAELERDRAPLQRDFPTLHLLLVDRWRNALAAVLREDLERMTRDGSRPASVEEEVRATLELRARDGSDITLGLHGRTDRIDRLADGGLRLIDFKTSANPAKDVNPKQVLSGFRPQLPTYALMLAQQGGRVDEATIRAVRPGSDDDEVEFEHVLAETEQLRDGEFGESFRETLAVLAALRRRGAFVPVARPGPCRFCDFRNACRRLHPPSVHRVATCGIAEADDYRLLEKKSMRNKRLTERVVR